MMQKTKINWCTHTWNPIVGCTPCSPGCENCYAKTMHDKRHKAYLAGAKLPAQYAKPFCEIQYFPERLRDPLKLKKPATIFVCSMGDLFHPEAEWEWQDEVFTAMYRADWHRYMVLTKRPKEMLRFFRTIEDWDTRDWPNLWLGVTVCNQAEADAKIPILLQTPAAHRFVSIEPMLGAVNLTRISLREDSQDSSEWTDSLAGKHCSCSPTHGYRCFALPGSIDLVIVGGETGPNARPLHPDWVRSIRDQCAAAGVPFHFAGWGEYCAGCQLPESTKTLDIAKSQWMNSFGETMAEESIKDDGFDNSIRFWRVGVRRAGRLLDGREHNGAREVR